MWGKYLFLFCLLQISGYAVSARSIAPREPIPVQTPVRPEIQVDHQTVYVRFQIPRTGQSTNQARVSTLQWASTVASVTSACLNFFNRGGNNDQLWRRLDLPTLQYAGLYSPQSMMPMTAQSSLNRDDVAGKYRWLFLCPQVLHYIS